MLKYITLTLVTYSLFYEFMAITAYRSDLNIIISEMGNG